ncbi:MAG: Trk system potassium transporter TrkA [Candidatus Eutrophobiaceae bacterium]
MKIIILGAGQVGSSVAINLVKERHDITVIDTDQQSLQALGERYDLRTVVGDASYPEVLEQAGGQDADMLIAVTDRDEINMLACQISYALFHTPTKIARIRKRDYLQYQEKLFRQEILPIDLVISPELFITQHIQRLIEYSGALQVLDFSDGKVQLVVMRVYSNGTLAGISIYEFNSRLVDMDFRVVGIYRGGVAISVDGDTQMRAGDEVFIIVAESYARKVLEFASGADKFNPEIMIVGASEVGINLALGLEGRYNVKLFERDRARAHAAAEKLYSRAIVLHGNAVDEELLSEEGVNSVGVFCALTGSDETNIISCMLAKGSGARKVLALLNRVSYVDLVQSHAIDIAISPQQITIGSVLAHVRRGDVAVVHSLRRGAAEAMETIAHGSKKESKVVGRRVSELALPTEVSIGAIVRGNEVLIAHHETRIEEEDHIVLLVSDRKCIPEMEALFQVSVNFP